MKTPPIWRLDIDAFGGEVASVSVTDDKGRHVASFYGPGMDRDVSKFPTNEEVLRFATDFVWGCGAKPEIHQEKERCDDST